MKLVVLAAFYNPLCELTGGACHWVDLGQGGDPDKGRCLGIRCNILARAQRQCAITHHLRGGVSHNIGWRCCGRRW